MSNAQPDQATRARIGRGISTIGLIGLAVAFFLPQFETAQEESVVPAHEFSVILLPVFFPFYFAFAMIVMYLLRALLQNDRAQAALSHAAPLVGLISMMMADFRMILMLPLLPCALLGTFGVLRIWFTAPSHVRPPAVVAAVGAVAFLSSLFLPWTPGGHYGVWVTLASCALLVAGGLVESLALAKAASAPEKPLEVPPPAR